MDKPKRYYAAPRNIKIATFRDFIDDIADRSIVSTPDIVAVMESLFQLIPTYLSNGRILKFGDLGTFTIKLVSEGQATEEEVNARTIKNVIVRFIPSKLFKYLLEKDWFGIYIVEVLVRPLRAVRPVWSIPDDENPACRLAVSSFVINI